MMKYSLFFALCLAMIIGILASSAFSSVSFVPVSAISDPIDWIGFAGPGLSSLQAPHFYEYGPAILAIGFAGPGLSSLQAPHFYEYGPAILATGFAHPGLASIQVPHFYEYGPAILATGFARPGMK